MGTFFTPLEISGPDRDFFVTVDALVDTGASYSMLPASMLQALGVSPSYRREFILANGERIHRDIGHAPVRIDGLVLITHVVFSDERSHPILGAMTLEQFSMAVDSIGRRLVPTSEIGIRRDERLGDAKMGTFFMSLEIAGPNRERFVAVDALVDSDVPYSEFPPSPLTSLGVSPIDKQGFILANGQRVYRDVGEAAVRIDGRVRAAIAVFSNEASHPILGAFTLAAFSVAVDTVNQRLVPIDAIGIRA